MKPGGQIIRKTRIAAATAVLALMTNQPQIAAPETGDASRIADLLSDAENQASLLKSDLGTLSFFASSETGWQSHVGIVSAYKEHIGALRSQAAKLDAARRDASRWQQTTIDRIVPLLQEFAASAEAAIGALDKNPASLNNSDYKQYVKLNADLAGEFSSLIGTWMNYGRTREELGQVAGKIGAPAAPIHSTPCPTADGLYGAPAVEPGRVPNSLGCEAPAAFRSSAVVMRVILSSPARAASAGKSSSGTSW
jgi:hypothetical protein